MRGTVATLILLLISVLVAKALDVFAFKPVIIGSVIFVSIICGIVGLVLEFQRNSHQEEIVALSISHRAEVEALSASHRDEIDFLIQKLQAIIPPPTFTWLLSDADIAKIEAKVKGQDIWIVSPDMHFDVIERTFQNVTKKNFQRGITYTYIVPKSYQMQARINILRRIYASYLSQVKIKELPEETFRQLAITHIDIYDPNAEDAKVFLQLPIKERGYWIELPQDEAHGIIGRFRRFVDQDAVASDQK